MADYVLRMGRHRLHIGVRARACEARDAPSPSAENWDLPRRALTVRQTVESLDTLFEAVCCRLGAAADRAALLASMTATLAIEGRESSLPLAALAFDDSLRRELTAQAATIGKALARWAMEANAGRAARRQGDEPALPGLELRSRCEGHLWTREATELLTGDRGGPVVMQLYNEWLHQLVLLRDLLLPFENWDEVLLPLDLHDKRGLRGVEAARQRFLVDVLTRLPTHSSIVSFARAIFDPATSVGSVSDLYGFQAEYGLVLPSVVGCDDLGGASKGLLRWHPAVVAPPRPGRTLAFRYALDDYLAAPRSVLGQSTPDAEYRSAAIVPVSVSDDDVTLVLEIGTHRVDLGQCLRGQRFAYRPIAAGTPLRAVDGIVHHAAGSALGQAGLVTAGNGIHVFEAGRDPLPALALLGKIYPENVVLAGDAPWRDVLAAGKGYGPQFVLGRPTDYAGVPRM